MTASESVRELLTPDEVSRRLRVSRQTIYRAIESGRLEAYRLGESGSLRVPERALEQFLTPAHEGGENG
jgi:excisionase family DNA binding protein